MNNLNDIFGNQKNKLRNKPLFWYKKNGNWVSISWNETDRQINILSEFLKKIDISKGDKVSLISKNSPFWCISDLAIMKIGAVTVPAYTTSNENELLYLLNHSESKLALLDEEAYVKIKKIKKRLIFTNKFILLENFTRAEKSGFFNYHENILNKNIKKNKKTTINYKVDKNDTACIIYTSGTSANPKGVMLSHNSIKSNIEDAKLYLDDIKIINHKFLSILPLSHAYERTGGFLLPIYIGGEIYFSNNRDQLLNDLQYVNPTLIVAVPRLYDVLLKKILHSIKSKNKFIKYLFEKNLMLGNKKYINEKLNINEKILDIIIGLTIRKKIKKIFGKNLMAFVSGGAALKQNAAIFFFSMGIKILQGYGQTENSPIISITPYNNIKLDKVGKPLNSTEIKLSKDKEILVRGKSLMQGYWKDKKSTHKTIVNGWLHTGDLGLIDDENYLKILGRKNEMIVNSGGENIAPTPIEDLLLSYNEIDQIMIYGHNKPYLVALVHPSEETGQNMTSIQKIFDEANKNLSSTKKIRKFYLIKEPFSIESLELTPTLKIKRRVVEKNYHKELQALYK
ncbi:MAG: long-chain fatty acid--CoA ligase [SAR116 cluster bacterium]|nr:long-chain fatty acid--CoA ligase [SAR116 cluster bacterium]RPH07944.1 MAG: long-chain fatty acid--CoA ligase [Alphaproteobacteria bacterium TMED54]